MADQLKKLIQRFNAARYLHRENEKALGASAGVYTQSKSDLADALRGSAIVVRATGQTLTVLDVNAVDEQLTGSNGLVYNFEDVDALL